MTDACACACAWQVHIDLHHMGVGGDDSWTHLRTVAEAHYVQAKQTSPNPDPNPNPNPNPNPHLRTVAEAHYVQAAQTSSISSSGCGGMLACWRGGGPLRAGGADLTSLVSDCNTSNVIM